MKHCLLIFALLSLADLSGKGRPGAKDSARIKLLLDSSNQLCNKNSYKDAFIVVAKASDLAEKSKDSVSIAQCINLKGYIYLKMGEYGESVRYFEKALGMLRNLKAPSELAAALVNIGITYKELAQYDKALRYLFEAVNYYEKTNELQRMTSAYTTVGNILRIEENYESALKYHFKALSLRRKINYSKGIAGSLHNIGTTYKEMLQYDSALSYFEDALLIKQKLSDPGFLATTFSQIGEIYERTQNYGLAETYYNGALSAMDKTGNKAEISHSMLQLGRLNYLMRQPKKSEHLLMQSLALSEEADAPDTRLECYNTLKDLFTQTGNSKRALYFAGRYITLHDTLLGIAKQKALIQLEMKYDVEKVQGEYEDFRISSKIDRANLEAKGQEDRKNNRNLAIWVATLVILVIALFLLLRNRNKYAKKLDMLMRELHHRVTNNLQVLSSIFYLQLAHIPKGIAYDTIRSNNDRVSAMMLIHKDLYRRDNITRVKIKDYVDSLVQNLLALHSGAAGVKVHYDIGPEIELEVDKAILLGLLVNELATNALKYAFNSNDSNPVFEIVFNCEQDGSFHLLVCDNGPGMPEEVPEKSMGLKLADSLVKQLKGTMKRTQDKGLCYDIRFR